MYTSGETDNRLNHDIMRSSLATLRERNASRYGLPNKVPSKHSRLIGGTTLYERRTTLGYNLDSLNEETTVLFTGQCLVKDEENLECPITLEDAIECERLKELLQKHPMPAICMYPDSTYVKFVEAWSGDRVSSEIVSSTTQKYVKFRTRIIPGITHLITSEVDAKLQSMTPPDTDDLEKRVRRIYGGRVLENGQTHPLQRTVLQYGIDEILLPMIAEHGDKDIVVFAEPDEICSIRAAELVRDALGIRKQIGLIGQLPLPSLGFPLGGKIRMYSASRKDRIHLNEDDSQIRKKLESDPFFSLLGLQLSPLTTNEQLEYLMKSRDRNIGIDMLMEQIKLFRRYVE